VDGPPEAPPSGGRSCAFCLMSCSMSLLLHVAPLQLRYSDCTAAAVFVVLSSSGSPCHRRADGPIASRHAAPVSVSSRPELVDGRLVPSMERRVDCPENKLFLKNFRPPYCLQHGTSRRLP
jgi:hypothetical protein